MRTTFFTAAPQDAGERLDRVVTAHCPELSRTRAQELIEAGLVLVEGRAAKGASRVRDGQRISVEEQPRPPLTAQAENIPLDVLYEDGDVMVINKPAGMTVHAGAGNPSGTLVNALLGRGQGLSQSSDLLRPGIVHRLDKDTSGAILVAKNDFAHAKVAEDFRLRVVKKTYLALVQGLLAEEKGRIELAISRDPLRRTRMTTKRSAILQNAREARTDWQVLARIAETTLLEVQLHTGRTHQIRVHFAALKHPVVGDTLYGASARVHVGHTVLPSLGRNFLHAAKLSFRQPRTGAWIEVRAALPQTLRDVLYQLAAISGQGPAAIDAALGTYL
ncbi:MAG: RluA family pseudouridine synthase [Candidatus Acidiferrum sp.]|jgi:23S rRNA pseudouridine1911/1915/1917 synthase